MVIKIKNHKVKITQSQSKWISKDYCIPSRNEIWIDGRPPNLHNREIDWSVFPENTDERKKIFNSCERRCLSNDGSGAPTLFPSDGFLSEEPVAPDLRSSLCNVPHRPPPSDNQFTRLVGWILIRRYKKISSVFQSNNLLPQKYKYLF